MLNRLERRGTLRRVPDGAWKVRATTIACLILLALLTLVQVAHVHPAATDADHCPLCVVMHSAAPVAAVVADTAVEVRTTHAPTPIARPAVRLWHCTLFNRPPPDRV
jgi:hypothetical protein